MKAFLPFLLLLTIINAGNTQTVVLDITAFGAKASPGVLNTETIQDAIDKAAESGGKVVVPKGRFLTGPIQLKSDVELFLAEGSVLLGSAQRMHYGTGPATALVGAKNQKNISITGAGTIDGQGADLVADLLEQLKAGKLQDPDWLVKRPAEYNRPRVIDLQNCSNVFIRGITVKNGSGWVTVFHHCSDVKIQRVTIDSKTYWNNDGIDIVDSRNVHIADCFVDAADDAIVLKSESANSFCENILVENCKLRSSANAFKLGTSSKGGFRNIMVRNIEVFDTYRSAIALESVDGGFLENINIEKVNAINTGNAFFIKLGKRNKDNRFSTVKQVRIADIKVRVPAGKPDKGYPMEGPLLRYPPGVKKAAAGVAQSVSPWNFSYPDKTAELYEHNVFPSSITGLPGHPVQSVLLENIEITYEGDASKKRAYFPLDSLAGITESVADYPEFSMFGELPCWGLYVRHAEGLVMKNVTLKMEKDDFRVACIFDDVSGLSVASISIPKKLENPVIVFHKTNNPPTKGFKLGNEGKDAIRIMYENQN